MLVGTLVGWPNGIGHSGMVVAFGHNEIFVDYKVTTCVATQWNGCPIGSECGWNERTRSVGYGSRCADVEQWGLRVGCFEEPTIVPTSIAAHIVFGWCVRVLTRCGEAGEGQRCGHFEACRARVVDGFNHLVAIE